MTDRQKDSHTRKADRQKDSHQGQAGRLWEEDRQTERKIVTGQAGRLGRRQIDKQKDSHRPGRQTERKTDKQTGRRPTNRHVHCTSHNRQSYLIPITIK
jgi:hypothetical protein